MNFLKKHYEAVSLALAAFLLLAVAVWGILQIKALPEAFAERNSPKPRDNNIPPAPVEPIRRALDLLQKPLAWRTSEGSVFASRIYILKDGNLFDPMEGDTPLHPPVENSWLLQYGLDYTQADILDSDPDEDGFTVLEEYKAKTSPIDPKSVPPYWTKLRFVSYRRDPFKVKFSGSPDGGETFTINFIDNPSERTRFLKIGDELRIAGIPYKVVKYTPKTVMRNEIERDESELLIENKASGSQIILVNDKIVDSPTSYATLRNLISGKDFEVKKGDKFTIEQEPGVEYQLVEVGDTHAIIRNCKTGEQFQIEK
jgi:hypothetical protein